MINISLVKDALYPDVEKALSEKKNAEELISYITKYLDRNSSILFDVNFSDRLVVSTTDKEIINKVTGISIVDAAKIIKSSTIIGKLEWVCNPFTVLMAMAIRYFSLNNMDKQVELCIVYVSCLYYTLLHAKSFPLGPPNREIMDYTLNNNPNITNSFIIKKEGSIFGMLKYTGVVSHEQYKKELIGDCSDTHLNNYLSAIRTRVNSNLKNIAKYFYEDHKAGNYFNKDVESYDEDNFHLTTSTTLEIAKIASKATTNIISYRFNKSFIDKVAALDSEVNKTKLTTIMDNIIEQNRKDIQTFISTILELYIYDGNQLSEVSTLKFLAHALNIYKTNSTKKEVIEIKKYLDKWIDQGSSKFGMKFIRPATINSYRKAMYMVFVYTINKEAK